MFSLDEARALVPHLRAVADEVIALRPALVDDDVALADRKASEARLAELLDGLTTQGIQVKGWAPLLVDLPSIVDGREVLLCWLEGERELVWYHDARHGFAGRRRL